MIARGSYEYKATSSHCDLTLGGQAAFWVSVELLKARGHIGGGHQCLLHPSVQPCIPASLHLSTASSWPHRRSHRQVCLQICQETEQYHTSCLHEDRGQPPSPVFISKHFRIFFKSPMTSLVGLWVWAPAAPEARKKALVRDLTKHFFVNFYLKTSLSINRT